MSPLFDPAGFVREVEAAARAGGWTIGQLSPVGAWTRPWLHRAGAGRGTFYLSAGIHGDEIAGPLAVLEMLRRPGFFGDFTVTCFPILNPAGLAANTRTNPQEIDLNRDYRATRSMEIAGHIETLRGLGRYDIALFLHEDYEGIGAYLYELNDRFKPGLGAAMIAAMSRHVPVDERPVIEEVPAIHGVIDRRHLIEKFGAIEDREEWPEAIYLSLHHTQASYTIETPLPFPLPQRVAAQIAAVETALAVVSRAEL